MEAEFFAACLIYGEDGCAAEACAAFVEAEWLAICAEGDEEVVAPLACAAEHTELREHDGPGEHGGEEERAEDEPAGQCAFFQRVKEAAAFGKEVDRKSE